MQNKLVPETSLECELRHLREQQDMREFLNRPSLRQAREKQIEKEADDYLERIVDFDSRR